MQRSLASQSSTQQAFAEKLQKNLRQAKAHSIPVMVQLTRDQATRQTMRQLLEHPIVDANAFLTRFIETLQAYKKAHRNKLGKSHPKHKHVWQLLYGNHPPHRLMVKQLLKQPHYGLTTHWGHWETVFYAINRQLRQHLPQPRIQTLSQTSLFAAPAPCPTTDNQQISMPTQIPQLQTVSPSADASITEDPQPTPTFMQRLRQFHQSHAVYFKFAKYLLIAATITTACIGASIGVAALLDLIFDLGAASIVLGAIKEILIGVKALILVGAKELFQLAKKNASQKLKDYHAQHSQAHLTQVDDSPAVNDLLHCETTTVSHHRFFHSAQHSDDSSTTMNNDTSELRLHA